ncbi:zinc finger protein, putative [Plasmodium vinckei brucechwatti]|uniref:Zinc finger protein, putative n=1 Tax=Plasmodium vinckei brucechwatti TaxID=119398 RepID=A0A6V7SBD4_PLAVN|nr:zinc finger protein, putative [Plasmodium vinckei brucechwatti]
MKMSITLRQHFWKTKLCPLHAENKCKEGDNCDYAHSIEDLRSIPDLKRTKLCYKLLKGEKCFNKKCNYAHNQDELKSAQNLFAYKSSMCKFIENKACLNGSTCRFAHNIDELRVPRIPEILLEKGSTEVDGKNDAPYYLDDNNNTNEKINNEIMENGESNIDNCYKIGSINNNGNINKEANINCNITGNNNCNMHVNRNNNNTCSMDANRNNYQRISSDRNINNGNFNNNFNMLLNNFNAMHINTNGEQIYNNQNFLNKYNNNINNNYHMYKNNAMNGKRDDRKRRDKNRNKNKEKQIKQKKNNYNKNYENYANNEGNAINNNVVQSIKKKEEGNYFYDSNTTIPSSLNFEEENDKSKINEAYGNNNLEKVDINECCEKIEDNGSIESNKNVNDHYNDRSTYENCNQVAYSNDKEKSLSKNKNKKKNMSKNINEDSKKNNTNCMNTNEQCINGLEGQYNYMDYNNYNYLNHMYYNKMMQMKFNPSIQYMNYQQINNIEGPNDALMPNNYSKFIKPNEYGLYDHQNNMPYMVAPNYYPPYLYYYTNPCNYNQCVIPGKTINNNNDKNINDKSPLKKNSPSISDTEVCQSDHDNNEEEEIVDNQINYEKDEESEEANCEKEKLISNDKICDEIDDKINEEETNKNDDVDKNQKSKSDVNIDNSITELTNKRDCIEKENKYSCIKKSTHSNNNDNIIRIEDKLNEQKGENVYDETSQLKIIKNQKTEKHRHQKTKRSKLVPLNKNGKKKFNKELHVNKDDNFNKQEEGNMETAKLVNDNVLNEQNRNCIKTQSASSSVYSYMHNANNIQNMSYDKNLINPPVPSIEMYHNNPCHMNELTNEQMVYNLNNRNIGYYYYPYIPTTYNDEVYLN